MSTQVSSQDATGGNTRWDSDGGLPPRRGRRKAVLAVSAVVVLAAAGGGAAWANAHGDFARWFNSNQHSTPGVTDNAYPTKLATVIKGSLSSQDQLSATLGYAGSYSVVNQASGIYSELPLPGQVIRRGHVLYEVTGAPVVLLYGNVPAYRSLSEGMSGPDVRELNANLVALKYATKSELDPTSDYFSAETAYALKLYQDHLGITQTGSLDLGQAVFLPGAARVTTINAVLGGPAGPGTPVLAATATARQVSIALDAADQSYVRVGDKVAVTLPDNKVTPGVVSSVGKVATTPPASAGATATPVITVDVRLIHPAAAGSLDQAPVQVSVTTDSVSGVLIVPVDALVSLAGGGYGVEAVQPNGKHKVIPVTLGLFDDAAGSVQVSGAGLQAGMHVVVPGL